MGGSEAELAEGLEVWRLMGGRVHAARLRGAGGNSGGQEQETSDSPPTLPRESEHASPVQAGY